MGLNDLEKQGRIRRIPVDKIQVKKALELCRRDLEAAEMNLKNDMVDWSFSISYNSILQACRALMYAYGYAPSSDDSHKATLEFVEYIFESQHSDIFPVLDRIRKKRHVAVYDEAGTVTSYEAKYALDQAKQITKLVEAKIKSKINVQ